MILVDSGVCAAMKRDVKQAGYLVFGIRVEGEHWVGLKGNGWIVLAELESMPRKILGLIVEHAGGIPGIGISWNIQKPKKGDVQRQDVMFGMIEREVTEMLEGDEGHDLERLRPVAEPGEPGHSAAGAGDGGSGRMEWQGVRQRSLCVQGGLRELVLCAEDSLERGT